MSLQFLKVLYAAPNKGRQSDSKNCHSFCHKPDKNKRHFFLQLLPALR